MEEAEAIGLISHRVPVGGLDGALAAIANQLLAKPPQALRETQRLLRQGSDDEILERMRLEGGIFAERLKSPEVKQAIGAFFAARNNNPRAG